MGSHRVLEVEQKFFQLEPERLYYILLMKKQIILLIMLLCPLVFSQPKLTVVIGAVGEDPKPGLRRALETQIKTAFVKDGRFTAVTREEAVLTMVQSEHIYQRTGAVDDSQIRQIGKQSGARYVCVVEISPLMESYMLSAQFIDIESAKIVTMASVPSALKNDGDFLAASSELVLRLLGRRAAAAQGHQGDYGKGIFLEESKNPNPLSQRLVNILKQKVTISDGTCVGGITAAIESPPEPACTESMVGNVCRADVSLIITRCKGGQKTIIGGSIVGSDKNSAAAARRQFERNVERAKFWDDWTNQLEKLSK